MGGSSPITKVVEMILLIAACFILPTMVISFEYDNLAQRQAEIEVQNFCETVSSRGYIDGESYYLFVSKLAAAGGVYEINIMHSQHIYEPEYVGGVFTGNVLEYTDETYTSSIIDEIDTYGAYLMDIGDEVKITARRKTESTGQKFLLIFLSKKNSNIAACSRTVSGQADQYSDYYR